MLLQTFFSLPPTSPAPISPPLTHLIHSLITIPVSPALQPIWLGGNKTSSKPQPDILKCAFDLLERTLSHYLPGDISPDAEEVREKCSDEVGDKSLDDVLAPLAVLITRLCSGDETSRARVRQWIVPDDLDRSESLEGRSDTLGRCLRLLGSVYHPRLKDSVGEMLYAMSGSDGEFFLCNSFRFLMMGPTPFSMDAVCACRVWQRRWILVPERSSQCSYTSHYLWNERTATTHDPLWRVHQPYHGHDRSEFQ